jgi:hypothetical protein
VGVSQHSSAVRLLCGVSSFGIHEPVNAGRVKSGDRGAMIILGPGLGEAEFALGPRAADER